MRQELADALDARIEALVETHFKACEENGAPAIRPKETEGEMAGAYIDILFEDEAISLLADEIARRIFERDALSRIGGKS